MKLFNDIERDFKSYSEYSGSNVRTLFKIHFYVNIFFRISHFLSSIHLMPFARIFWLINRVFFSIDIDPRARLAGGFVIVHGIGLVIGRYVISEGHFRVYHGATLGGNMGKIKEFRGQTISQPYIYSNVVIGINSSILGPVVINENAIIGTAAIVTKDVPSNSIVIGNNTIMEK